MTEENRQLLQEEIIQLIKLKGLERGADIKVIIDYIVRKEGKNRYKEFVKVLSNFGFDLPDVKKTSSMEWIPEFIPHILMVGAFRFFDWNDEDIFKMGKEALNFSRTLKIFVKWSLSIKKTIVISAGNWRKYYTHGNVKLEEFNKSKQTGLLVVSDFKTHPVLCVFLQEYLLKF